MFVEAVLGRIVTGPEPAVMVPPASAMLSAVRLIAFAVPPTIPTHAALR